MPDARLYRLDLTKAWFQSANLGNADFDYSTLTDADFSHSNLAYADFSRAMLSGADISQSNLSHAVFYSASLIGVDFSGAEVRGANFSSSTGSGLSAAQLYSTASYQAGDLSGLRLGSNALYGWNFVGQDLAKADFYLARLTGVGFGQANLTFADFFRTKLAGADFTGADTRSANRLSFFAGDPRTRNMIFPDGVVHGLGIGSGESIRLWDYDADRPLRIEIHDEMEVDAGGTLRIVLEDAEWGSTLTFEPGIDVLRDGKLELAIDPDEETTLASLVGVTFDLFDWAGVSPDGEFASIVTENGLVWDLTQLYTTGDVMLTNAPAYLAGDFDASGHVDGDDFLIWQSSIGMQTGAGRFDGDADFDGDVDSSDFLAWQANFDRGGRAAAALGQSAVPEPSAIVLGALVVVGSLVPRWPWQRDSRARRVPLACQC